MQTTQAIGRFVRRKAALLRERNVNSFGRLNFRCLRSDCFACPPTQAGYTIGGFALQGCNTNEYSHLRRSTFGLPYRTQLSGFGVSFATGSTAVSQALSFQASNDTAIRWSPMTF